MSGKKESIEKEKTKQRTMIHQKMYKKGTKALQSVAPFLNKAETNERSEREILLQLLRL